MAISEGESVIISVPGMHFFKEMLRCFEIISYSH